MPRVMDGTSYFPSRPEMERGLVEFATSAGLRIRYGCRWESTRVEGGDFVLSTSDGEYRTPLAVVAVGGAEPGRPQTLDAGGGQQEGERRPPGADRGPRCFTVGNPHPGFGAPPGL